MEPSRRDVMQAGAAAVGAIALARLGSPDEPPVSMPRRSLGKIGREVGILALGSAEMGSDEATVATLHALLDAGVDYWDTAPSYMETRSESTIGQVLRERREEVFLATKTLARDADGAYREIRESLARLQTEVIDTLQIHAVNDFGTLDQVLSAGGAVEGLERARDEGLIRHLGITGHTRPEVIQAAVERYPFESILVPVSAVDTWIGDFGASCIPEARKRGVAVIGMKSLKGMERARPGQFEAGELLRYTWSQPVDTLTVGLRQNEEAAKNVRSALAFSPMPKAELAALRARLREFANPSHLWWKAT